MAKNWSQIQKVFPFSLLLRLPWSVKKSDFRVTQDNASLIKNISPFAGFKSDF